MVRHADGWRWCSRRSARTETGAAGSLEAHGGVVRTFWRMFNVAARVERCALRSTIAAQSMSLVMVSPRDFPREKKIRDKRLINLKIALRPSSPFPNAIKPLHFDHSSRRSSGRLNCSSRLGKSHQYLFEHLGKRRPGPRDCLRRQHDHDSSVIHSAYVSPSVGKNRFGT